MHQAFQAKSSLWDAVKDNVIIGPSSIPNGFEIYGLVKKTGNSSVLAISPFALTETAVGDYSP